jgi:hypothetical protein
VCESDHRARKRAREDILLRFKELSWQDQYKTYQVIQGYFIHSGSGSAALKELRERAECVKALQRVAKHLKLRDEATPGVQQYEQARKDLGIELSAATIVRRWEVWREVCKAARGERVSQTARQRAQFRAAIKQKQRGEEWLTGVREWLLTRPPALSQSDYNEWTQERNERSPLPPVAGTESIRTALSLPWRTTVSIAKGETSLVDAQAKRREELQKENGEFVTITAIALIHGVTTRQATVLTHKDTFPHVAFKLHQNRVWRLSDIEAHHTGEAFPERKASELQPEIMDSVDICRLCRVSQNELKKAMLRLRVPIPPPTGSIAGAFYWFRTEVEDWARANPDIINIPAV